ncbi:MAG: type II toxin-antitoxin system HigA family antitoxin [Pyrinomonadaceae bacterium]
MTTMPTINPARYRKLLSKAMPVAIETEAENDRLLAEVYKLMDKGEDLPPEEEMLLRLMVTLIEEFERKFYQPGDATPLEVLHHLMAARDLKQSDLWEIFGSKSTASQVLNGKRSISKENAKALAKFFGVSVELFI